MNKINREKIAEGVHFSSVTDERYKVNRICVTFFTQLSEKASVNALVPRLLACCNKSYPTRKQFNEKRASLYSAKIDFNVSSIGDSQQLELYSVSIDNKYALEKEDVTDTITDMLLECVFKPAFNDMGRFDEALLNQEKKALIEAIEAELNDKRVYARKRLYETLYEGEPAAISALGTVEGVNEAESDSVCAAYRKLLQNSPVEIFAIGCNDFKGVREKVKKAFGAFRENIEECSSNPGSIKGMLAEKIEKMPVAQSKMVIGYKTSYRNFPAITLMTMIFGGMTTSKLFTNVREKMSLCYYCWASFGRDKCVMVVDSGVEGDDIDKAHEAIGLQLEAVQKGDFSQADIEAAKLSIANTVKSFYDSPASTISWYITRIYRGDIKTPEESLLEYDGVTREEIIEAAKSMTADTIYILTSDEQEK